MNVSKWPDWLRRWYGTWTGRQKRQAFITLVLAVLTLLFILSQSGFWAALVLISFTGSALWLALDLAGQQEVVKQHTRQLYRRAQQEYQTQQERFKTEQEKKRQEAEAARAAALERQREEEKQKQEEARWRAWFNRNYEANLLGAPTDPDFRPVFYSIAVAVAAGSPWKAADAIACVRAILQQVNHGRLAVVATHDEIVWVVTLESENEDAALQTIRHTVSRYYPGVQVEPYQETMPNLPLLRRTAFINTLPYIWMESGQLGSAIRSEDPLTTLVGAMDQLEPGEVIRFEFVIYNQRVPDDEEIQNELTLSAYDKGFRWQFHQPTVITSHRARNDAEVIGSAVGGVIGWGIKQGIKAKKEKELKETLVDRYDDPKQTQRYLRKLQQPIISGVMLLSMDGYDEMRVQVIFDGLLSALSSFDGDYVVHSHYLPTTTKLESADDWRFMTPNHLYQTHGESESMQVYYNQLQKIQAGLVQAPEDFKLHPHTLVLRGLTPDEVAAYWHLPHGNFSSSTIRWAQQVPEPLMNQPEGSGIVVGMVGKGRKRSSITIAQRDRAYHMTVTGMIGMGKTTLVHNITRQTILQGDGLAVIDPTGGLIDRILATSVPREREADLVLLEVGNSDYPVPVNPLRVTPAQEEDEVIAGILWMLQSLYTGLGDMTRINTTLRSLLPLMLAYEEAVPYDMLRVLNNDVLRTNLIRRAQMSQQMTNMAGDFWTRYEAASPSARAALTQTTTGRLSSFLGSRPIELLTCHPYTLDYQQIIRERKILLIDLRGNNIVADRGVLGAMFFIQLYLASLALGQIPPNQPPRFYLFIDEADLFLSSALPEIFAKVRQYGLSLMLVCQSMNQFDEDTRRQLQTTRGTFFSLGTDDPDEAQVNAKAHMPYLSREELLGLGKGQAALKTRFRGNPLPSFILDTLDEPKPLHTALDVAALKRRSREQIPVITPDRTQQRGLPHASKIRRWWKEREQRGVYLNDPVVKQKEDGKPEVDGTALPELRDLDPDYRPEERTSESE